MTTSSEDIASTLQFLPRRPRALRTPCCRYIELDPVRAGMVADPARYPWSSHRTNAYCELDGIVMPHAVFRAQGRDRHERAQAYREFVSRARAEAEIEQIRLDTQKQPALGGPAFRFAIEAQLGRGAGPAKMGRPRKPTVPADPQRVL